MKLRRQSFVVVGDSRAAVMATADDVARKARARDFTVDRRTAPGLNDAGRWYLIVDVVLPLGVPGLHLGVCWNCLYHGKCTCADQREQPLKAAHESVRC